jgi:hypothetical protein
MLKALGYTQHAPGQGAGGNQVIVDKCDRLGLNQINEKQWKQQSARIVIPWSLAEKPQPFPVDERTEKFYQTPKLDRVTTFHRLAAKTTAAPRLRFFRT